MSAESSTKNWQSPLAGFGLISLFAAFAGMVLSADGGHPTMAGAFFAYVAACVTAIAGHLTCKYILRFGGTFSDLTYETSVFGTVISTGAVIFFLVYATGLFIFLAFGDQPWYWQPISWAGGFATCFGTIPVFFENES